MKEVKAPRKDKVTAEMVRKKFNIKYRQRKIY